MANMEARIKITFYVIIVASYFFSVGLTEVVKFGECGDEECSEPVAEGITVNRYHAPDEDLVSFHPNAEVKIFSKNAGEKSDLIGIEVNGNRGYAPEKFIKEMRKIKDVKFPAKQKFNLQSEPSVASSFSSSLNPTEDASSKKQSVFGSSSMAENNDESKSTVSENDIKYGLSGVVNGNSPTSVPLTTESSEKMYASDSDVVQEEQQQFVDHSKISNGIEVSSNVYRQEETSLLNEKQNTLFATLGQHDVIVPSSAINPSVSTTSNQEHGSVSNIPSPLDGVIAQQPDNDISVPKELTDSKSVDNDKNSESETNVVPLTSSFQSVEFSDAASEQSSEHHSVTDMMMTSEVDAPTQAVPPLDQSESSSKTEQSQEVLSLESLNTDTIKTVKEVLHETMNKLEATSEITHSNSLQDDIAKTMAMLEKQGITDFDLYGEKNVVENITEDTEFNNGLYADSTQNIKAKIHSSSTGHSKENKFLAAGKMNYINHIGNYKSQQINAARRNAYAAQHHKRTETSVSDDPRSALTMLTDSNQNNFDKTVEQMEHVTDEKEKQPICHESQKTDDKNTCKNITENSKNEKNIDSANNYDNTKDEVDANLLKDSKEYATVKEKVVPFFSTPVEHTKKMDYSAIDTSQSAEHVDSSSSSSVNVQYNEKIAANSDQSILDTNNFVQKSFQQIQSDSEVTKHSSKYEMSTTSTISHSSVNSHINTGSIMSNSEPNTELLNSPATESDHKEQVLEMSVNETVDHEVNILNEFEPAESELLDEDYAQGKEIENYEEITSTESYYNSRQLKSEADSLAEGSQEMYSSNENFSFYISLSFYHETIMNGTAALRSVMQSLIVLLPEPFQTRLADLESQGVSPRLTVFTVISAVSSIFIFVALMYIKKSSKEGIILAKLSSVEQKLFTTSTERDLLKEELETSKTQLMIIQRNLEEEQTSVSLLRSKLQEAENCSQNDNLKQRNLIENLKKEVESNLCSISEYQKAVKAAEQEKMTLQLKLQEEEHTVSNISIQLQEIEEEARTLQKEKEKLTDMEENCKSRLVQLEQSCNQLLQEAEVWNARVNELTGQLENEKLMREELESSVESKDTEIKSLKNLIEHLELIQAVKDYGEGTGQDLEKQIAELMNASAIQVQLEESQKENESLSERLETEKTKLLDMEVELLDAKSEAEKLKLNYNQALQDKTEAQTKLGVLTNYFKEKEVLLQKELGVQEAVRQQKEEDASSAERRIALIDEENSSYKYQIASLKQELEETERNFKNQVAIQEKRAHESWIAARAAERKAEEMKQEAAQLRQRLTLLERQQESWTSASHDEIVRPVPKRFAGPNGEIMPIKQALSQNTSSSSLEYPITSTTSMSNERIHPLTPMMLPPDRPLPPLDLLHPLPPPPFMPPMDPRIPPPYRPEAWHMPLGRHPDPNYEQGRLSTPPRRHHSPPFFDREGGRHSSSPQEGNSRDSHSSSPQHPLPHFHDIPPPPRRPYDFPPPPHLHSRFPPPPRREPFIPGPLPIRTDSRNADMVTSTPRGAQQPTALQDKRQHQQPNTRV